MVKGTYPDFITYKGKKYRYRSRAYATTIIQGKRAKDALTRFAKRERERGKKTRIFLRDRTWWLDVYDPKAKV